VIWLSVAFGVALAAPSLTTGTCADDWLQWMVARGLHPFAGLPSSHYDLFSFAGHDPRNTPLLMDAGVFPWWTNPAVKIAFWRPLSSLTHLIDWSLWPESPLTMHAHNLLWFALALASVAAFYRRFFDGGWAAGLGTLLYAVDDAHGSAVGWIANRNAMIAVALALPVLLAHDRWRRDRWRQGAWLAPALFGLALLAGESALAVAAYLVAYALFIDGGSGAARARSLLPYLGVVVAWRVVYHALGYGTAHSGIYLDPASDPIAFLRALPSRAAFLLAAQFALPWSDFAPLYSFVSAHFARVMLTAAALTVLAFVALFTPLCRRDPLARFFAVGTLLAVVPVCSTFPADRLLWFVGIGAMGLIARFIELAPRAWWSYAVVSLLVLLHVVLAVPLLALRSRSMVTVATPVLRANDSLPSTAALAGRTVVMANTASDLFGGYVTIYRGAIGEPLGRVRWLATAGSAVTITRLDERSLRVRPEHGFFDRLGEQLLRSPSETMPRGSRVELTGMTIEVTELEPDGRPAEVRASFDRALEDPSFYWCRWERGRYVAWSPPPVGKSVVLPSVNLIEALFKQY
jgi:hypothetical protein